MKIQTVLSTGRPRRPWLKLTPENDAERLYLQDAVVLMGKHGANVIAETLEAKGGYRILLDGEKP